MQVLVEDLVDQVDAGELLRFLFDQVSRLRFELGEKGCVVHTGYQPTYQ